MPRKTSSYWTAMDFGSEDEDSSVLVTSKSPTTRVYVDPWDLENYAFMRRHLEGTPEPHSPAGEPTSSSTFYYVTKEDHDLLYHHQPLERTLPSADSPTLFAGIDELDFHNENFEMPYCDTGRGGHQRRRPCEDFMMERKFVVPRPTLTGMRLFCNDFVWIFVLWMRFPFWKLTYCRFESYLCSIDSYLFEINSVFYFRIFWKVRKNIVGSTVHSLQCRCLQSLKCNNVFYYY